MTEREDLSTANSSPLVSGLLMREQSTVFFSVANSVLDAEQRRAYGGSFILASRLGSP
jgi:hypothetical protein